MGVEVGVWAAVEGVEEAAVVVVAAAVVVVVVRAAVVVANAVAVGEGREHKV